ncbi:MAG: TetR/AcrR family transcriptional regulator [Kiritimatiellae bacterium]|jgi:AcrR family transcriptional regulator|nr:TetR/AcrR family transcriptional regulator [Kiritimatiellia bacterium]
MARKTKEDAAKTRRKILKAALDLFSKKGYDKTTFEDIAARIKLSKGAVYWHFSSKPELLRQVVIYVFDEATGDQMIINSQPETFEELRSGLKEWMARVLTKPQNRKNVRMLISLDWTRPALKDVADQFKKLDNSVVKVTKVALTRIQERGEIRSDVDVQTFAYTIGLTWIGMLHCQLSVEEKEYEVNDIIDCLMDSVGKNILV